MDTMNLYVYEDRNIAADTGQPIMVMDCAVQEFCLHIPTEINGFDMGDWSWFFVYVNADKKTDSIPIELELTTNAEEEDEYTATVEIRHGMTSKAGEIRFAVEAFDLDGRGMVIHEWHSKSMTRNVANTLYGEHRGIRRNIPK